VELSQQTASATLGFHWIRSKREVSNVPTTGLYVMVHVGIEANATQPSVLQVCLNHLPRDCLPPELRTFTIKCNATSDIRAANISDIFPGMGEE
jgi:hypothetical protein